MNLQLLASTFSQELLKYSKNKSPDYYFNFVNIFEKYSSQDWKNYISNLPKEKNIHNKYLIPLKNPDFDFYLIHWPPFVKSPIHSHSDFGCFQKILEGELLEKRFTLDNQKYISEQILQKNQVAFINDFQALHQVINPSNKDSFSLHIYPTNKNII